MKRRCRVATAIAAVALVLTGSKAAALGQDLKNAAGASAGIVGSIYGHELVKMHTVWDGVPDKFNPDRVNAAWLAERCWARR